MLILLLGLEGGEKEAWFSFLLTLKLPVKSRHETCSLWVLILPEMHQLMVLAGMYLAIFIIKQCVMKKCSYREVMHLLWTRIRPGWRDKGCFAQRSTSLQVQKHAERHYMQKRKQASWHPDSVGATQRLSRETESKSFGFRPLYFTYTRLCTLKLFSWICLSLSSLPAMWS